jgi:hypothetical protein
VASDSQREPWFGITLDAIVAEASEKAQQVLDAPDAMAVYRKGLSFASGLILNSVASNAALEAVATPLYLIWADLTDAIDAPGAKPDPTDAAERMRRAAREWLLVAAFPHARQQYLSRWMYEECGYERPTEQT